MTILYKHRPKHNARADSKYIDTPMGLVPIRVTKRALLNLKDMFMTWGGVGSTAVSEVYMLEVEEQHEGAGPEGVQ